MLNRKRKRKRERKKRREENNLHKQVHLYIYSRIVAIGRTSNKHIEMKIITRRRKEGKTHYIEEEKTNLKNIRNEIKKIPRPHTHTNT